MEKLKSELLKEQMESLKFYRKQLKENERVFIKHSGIAESIEQYRVEISQRESELESEKDKLYELKAAKSDAVKGTLMAVQDRITELLPEGEGIVHIEDDGSFVIGWMLPSKPLVPYAGLSGGQKVIFGRALSNALMGDAKNKVLIYEAAEVDSSNLLPMLEQIEANTEPDTQVIASTWYAPEEVPTGWNVITL